MKLNGRKNYRIVKKLQDEGIRPRHSPRGVWSTSTLTTMLRHEGYIGKAHWGSSYATIPENPKNRDRYRKVKKSSRKSKPKENWYIVKIPAIIDEDLFRRARNQLELNLKTHQRNKINDYLLSGLIRCTCGRTRAGEGPKHGAHLYYRCSDRVSSFPLKRTCFKRGLNARIADRLVWDKLNELMSNPTLIAKELDRWNKQGQSQIKNEVIDIKAAKHEILKLKKEEDRYNRAYGAGVFTITQLKGYLTPLRERLSKLEASIVEASKEITISKADGLEELISLFNIALETPIVLNQDLDFGEKRAIITRTIDQVVGDQEGLKISGHIPLQTHVEQSSNNNKGILSLISTSNVELCSEDRNCGPTKRREIDAF